VGRSSRKEWAGGGAVSIQDWSESEKLSAGLAEVERVKMGAINADFGPIDISQQILGMEFQHFR